VLQLTPTGLLQLAPHAPQTFRLSYSENNKLQFLNRLANLKICYRGLHSQSVTFALDCYQDDQRNFVKTAKLTQHGKKPSKWPPLAMRGTSELGFEQLTLVPSCAILTPKELSSKRLLWSNGHCYNLPRYN
jgi:hypothetical protein